MRIVYKLPHPIDRYIRTLMMTLPRSLAPKPPSFGGVVEIDPGRCHQGTKNRAIAIGFKR
jgi:hypothetical protein